MLHIFLSLFDSDMVKASHIKPLEKEDRLDQIKFIQPWNVAAHSHGVKCSTASQDTKDPVSI